MPDQQTVRSADLQLDAVAGVAVAARTPQYITLHTARPPSAANEVSGNSYARQSIANTGWTKATADGVRRLLNAAVVRFPTPTGSGWSTSNGCIAVWDRLPSAGGAMALFYIELSANFAAGDPVEWAIGSLSYGMKLQEG